MTQGGCVVSIGKYSPTVRTAYSSDQNWWTKNGGGTGNGVSPDSIYDNDGYDEFGYNNVGHDRASNTEHDYVISFSREADTYILYEETYRDWGYDEETHKPILATYY